MTTIEIERELLIPPGSDPRSVAFNGSICWHDGVLYLAYRVDVIYGIPSRIYVCALDRWAPRLVTHVILKNPAPPKRIYQGTGLVACDESHWMSFQDPRLISCGGSLWMSFVAASRVLHGAVCQGLTRLNKDFQPEETIYHPWGSNHNAAYFGEVRTGDKNSDVCEKNWTYFDHNGVLKCLYTVNPLVVKGQETDPPPAWSDIKWEYGSVSGGTPLVHYGGKLLGMFHSFKDDWKKGQRNYYSGWYEVDQGLWELSRASSNPALVADHNPERDLRTGLWWRPNVAFPCGLALVDGQWAVSYGWQDCRMKVSLYEKREIEDSLVPVRRVYQSKSVYNTDAWTWLSYLKPPCRSPFKKSDHIESFCTITDKVDDLEISLFTLRQYHTQPVYILGTPEVERAVGKLNLRGVTVIPLLTDKFLESEYQKMPQFFVRRTTATCGNNWRPFMYHFGKAKVIDYVLRFHPNTAFFDTDLVFTNPIKIDPQARFAAVPHYFSSHLEKVKEREWGRYNGGFLFFSDASMLDQWNFDSLYNSTSTDQLPLSTLLPKLPNFCELGRENNIGHWRTFHLANQTAAMCESENKLSVSDNIYTDGVPVTFFHVHYAHCTESEQFLRPVVLSLLERSPVKKHKDALSLVERLMFKG